VERKEKRHTPYVKGEVGTGFHLLFVRGGVESCVGGHDEEKGGINTGWKGCCGLGWEKERFGVKNTYQNGGGGEKGHAGGRVYGGKGGGAIGNTGSGGLGKGSNEKNKRIIL